MAVDPLYRSDWALENVLVIIAAVALGASYRYRILSRVSYTCIFIFLCLHEIGAHYTYSEVPYDTWFRVLTGKTFNELVGWKRNNYDRLVHYSYGFLLVYPIREVLVKVLNVHGFWSFFLSLDLVMSTSMAFELFEWGAATIFGGDLGMAYLGTQGDMWDSHKDMALASAGALTAIGFAVARELGSAKISRPGTV